MLWVGALYGVKRYDVDNIDNAQINRLRVFSILLKFSVQLKVAYTLYLSNQYQFQVLSLLFVILNVTVQQLFFGFKETFRAFLPFGTSPL